MQRSNSFKRIFILMRDNKLGVASIDDAYMHINALILGILHDDILKNIDVVSLFDTRESYENIFEELRFKTSSRFSSFMYELRNEAVLRSVKNITAEFIFKHITSTLKAILREKFFERLRDSYIETRSRFGSSIFLNRKYSNLADVVYAKFQRLLYDLVQSEVLSACNQRIVSAFSSCPTVEFDSNVYNTFPNTGMSQQDLMGFLRRVGTDRLMTLSTGQVCFQYVVPYTAKLQLSYCEQIAYDYFSDEYVGLDIQDIIKKGTKTPTVFVSHAWDSKFLDVIGAIVEKFNDDPDAIIWFDIFSVNQHTNRSTGNSWWSDTFKAAVQRIKHTVVVLSPLDKPIVFQRAWCLFEMYCSISNKDVRFELAASSDELQGWDTNRLSVLRNQVDMAKSRARNASDRKFILETILMDGKINIKSKCFLDITNRPAPIVKSEQDLRAQFKSDIFAGVVRRAFSGLDSAVLQNFQEVAFNVAFGRELAGIYDKAQSLNHKEFKAERDAVAKSFSSDMLPILRDSVLVSEKSTILKSPDEIASIKAEILKRYTAIGFTSKSFLKSLIESELEGDSETAEEFKRLALDACKGVPEDGVALDATSKPS